MGQPGPAATHPSSPHCRIPLPARPPRASLSCAVCGMSASSSPEPMDSMDLSSPDAATAMAAWGADSIGLQWA
ncbi:hypothetical protein SEVIR_2G142350v4 [Setaria viridis]